MSERFWIIVIVAVAVLLLVLMLRRQLKRLALKGMGMEAEVETHGAESARPAAATETVKRRAGINISDVNQDGGDNLIDVGRDDVNIEKIRQKDRNRITVRPDQPGREEK